MPAKKYKRMIVLLLAVGTLAAETKSERTDCYGDPLPKGAIARMGTIRLRDCAISQVAFSPDGKLLASGSWGGLLRVWDAVTGREIHVFAAHQDYYGSFAFSPDGKSLVARGTDRRIRFWDLATGKLIRTFRTPEGVHKIALSPNGKILATIGGKTARLCDAATCIEILAITAPHETFFSLAFSPDGKMLATGGIGLGQTIWLWDTATGKQVCAFHGPRSDNVSPAHVYSVAFSPDGKRLATAADDAVCLWEVASGKQLRDFKHGGQAFCVAFAPDGKVLASVGNETVHTTVRLWDPAIGKEVRQFGLPQDMVRSLAFSPDGKILATGDLDRLRLWDPATGQAIRDHRGHSSPVCSVAYSPDGKLLASGSDDKTVRLWDPVTGKGIRIYRGHQNDVSSVTFSPDGKTVASAGLDKTVRLCEAATGKAIRTIQGNSWIKSLAYSPNGKHLAAGGLQRFLQVWDPSAEKEMPLHLECNESIDSVVFAPNGKHLAAGGLDSNIHLWEVSTGKAIRIFSSHQNHINSVAFSPDGQLIASGGHDKTARIWDTDSGQQMRVLRHSDNVWSVAFSPDGMLLASGGWGRQVHLWDVLTGKEIHAFSGHRGAIFSVSFSPDGRMLASGGRDTSCLVWDVATPIRTKPSDSRLSVQQRERFWSALGGNDALVAWRAVFRLAADSDRCVPFLDRHLQAALLDPRQVRRWIADLDSDTFAVREAAQRELEQWGEVVAPALKQALQDKPSLEARKRMERLLVDMKSRIPSGEYLSALRALTVLELIGTPAARRVLEKMAQGNPLDRCTRSAKAALQRLAARRDTIP